MRGSMFSARLCATILMALFAVVADAQAQSAVITGKITGRQGEALGGVIVAIDEISTAVATTTSGTYTLTVAPEKTKGQTVTLRARHIEYSPGVRQIARTPRPPPHDLEDISYQAIDRVEVVKGAAASSLYGSDAANGVIQIFTKRGERIADGKLVVTVRNEYGQSFRPTSIPQAMAHPYRIDTIGTYQD